MEFSTPKCMKLLGFVESHRVPRQSFMGTIDMVLPTDSAFNKKAMAGLINALLAQKKYAIVRFVYREKKAGPKMCALIPHKTDSYECFYMAELPTSESIRDYQYNSLKESTEQQRAAVGKLIDRMNLSSVVNEVT